jgi:ribosome-associated translation inhibitor RaiA
MSNNVSLFVIGLPKNKPVSELLRLKFGGTLDKAKKIFPKIIEAKISVKSQNVEGSKTHYDVKSTVITSKNRFSYTQSGWDILKICEELCRKLEGDLSKHADNRQRESIRKRGVN